MSDSPQYEAFRAFARSEIAFQVERAKTELKEILTREAPKIVEASPAKDGKDGRGVERMWIDTVGELCVHYTDGSKEILGPVAGKNGDKGDRGTDGIATLEDLKAAAREEFADFQVRTFADVWQGTYKNGELYHRGILTTWGGALWLSMAETKARPGETPDWKLVVKK